MNRRAAKQLVLAYLAGHAKAFALDGGLEIYSEAATDADSRRLSEAFLEVGDELERRAARLEGGSRG